MGAIPTCHMTTKIRRIKLYWHKACQLRGFCINRFKINGLDIFCDLGRLGVERNDMSMTPYFDTYDGIYT